MQYTKMIYIFFGFVVTATEICDYHFLDDSSFSEFSPLLDQRTDNPNLPYKHSIIEANNYSLFMKISKSPIFNKKKYYENLMQIALPEETKSLSSLDKTSPKMIVALDIDLQLLKEFDNKRIIMSIWDKYQIEKIRFLTIRGNGVIFSEEDLEVLKDMLKKYKIENISIQKHSGEVYEAYTNILEPYITRNPRYVTQPLTPTELNTRKKSASIKFNETEKQSIEKKKLSFAEKWKNWFYNKSHIPTIHKEYNLEVYETQSEEKMNETNENIFSIFLPITLRNNYDHIISSAFHEEKEKYFKDASINKLILHNPILKDIVNYDFLKNIENIVIYTNYDADIQYENIISDIQKTYSSANFEINISNTNEKFLQQIVSYKQNAKFNYEKNSTNILLLSKNTYRQ